MELGGEMMELYHGGKIYTLIEEGHTVDAVLVRDGIINRTGTFEELKNETNTHINLQGATMIPGLVDSHIHLISYGMMLANVQLGDVKTKAQIKERLYEAAQNLAPDEWLIAEGWNEFNLEEGEMLTLQELDEITINPVILHRVCHHVMLVNSTVLSLAGITNDTLIPAGGVIGRTQTGAETGYLYDEATQLALQLLPTEGEGFKQFLTDCIENSIAKLQSYGVVGAHTEDCSYYGHYTNVIHAYNETIGKHKHFRTHLLRHHKVFNEMVEDGVAEVPGFLEFGAMKIFADGSFGGSTAALLEPYNNEGKNKGLFIHSYDQFETVLLLARSKNEAIAVHMIGDASAELVISMIEKYPTPKGKRDRLIHACLVNEKLLERMRKLNIIIDIQPAFVPSDYPWIEAKLGEQRMRYAYAWKTLRDFHPAIGTDAPIESANPYQTIAAAVQRNKYGTIDYNEQLTVYEAVKMYTYGAAYAANKEHERGLIQEGYVADFTLLDQNIFEIEHAQITHTKALQTIVAGKVVYNTIL